MKKIFFWFVGINSLIVLVLVLWVDAYGVRMPEVASADAIIVAGCRVQSDGTPSLALQARTDHAVTLYRAKYAPRIVFTGGSPDSRITEAQAAKKYAIKKYGLPASVLWVEETSSSTEENAKHTKALYPDLRTVIVVSDSYHIYRAQHVFERYFEKVDASGRVPPWDSRWQGAFREVWAIGYYMWNGRI